MKAGDPIHPIAEWNLTCSLTLQLVALELFVQREGQTEPFREPHIYGLTRVQARDLANEILSQLHRLDNDGKPDTLVE